MSHGFTDPARQSATAFRALMEAMARPGSIHTLSGAAAPGLSPAAATVLLLLADPTTPVHLAGGDPDLAAWLRFHAGCPLTGPEGAALALGRWPLDLDPLPKGLPDYPDRSATVIMELDRLDDDGPRLTGPGIRDHARLSLPATAPFVANRRLFPMGLDFIFTCGDRLACLPRSTRVEAA
ncbi:phosphonate C-P lyase system protein PhnH [Paracoccus aestuarii]|uniref:Phosphonate C-P lyase system protein PhnH n=1 Tax=Paracoccus aestuarii TaxID=453842 RepID=A0A419A008_9RHOB|nr:phosphonate C-P lyase system protein PhnH [Paracoccus aestuarii]RJL06187.1 phosphonate C-P lyase system protein PhnH [Paracoccus aestuarii]WCQ98325.1 phosphonate C-P lyase system protein PhnH [Paracoccus aestuarii]